MSYSRFNKYVIPELVFCNNLRLHTVTFKVNVAVLQCISHTHLAASDEWETPTYLTIYDKILIVIIIDIKNLHIFENG